MDDWVDVKISLPRPAPPIDLADVEAFYDRVRQTALQNLATHKSPIFTVETGHPSFNQLFIQNLPSALQQTFTCSTCRQFLHRFGSLALVDDDGKLVPLLWNPSDKLMDKRFQPAVLALATRFEGKKAVEEFKVYQTTRDVGKNGSGGFMHFHLTFPNDRTRNPELAGLTVLRTAKLAAMLSRIMADYNINTVRQCSYMLEQDKLPNAHNFKAAARWLLDLHENKRISGLAKGNEVARHNLTYRYAASSFAGCLAQLRNGVPSKLLESIEANDQWKKIEAKWNNFTKPETYLRPQSAPKAGNIVAAERLFGNLGITKYDMRRKFLTFADIPEAVFLWKKRPNSTSNRVVKESTFQVFGNVAARPVGIKAVVSNVLPATPITFTSFVNKVLPRAKKIEYKLAPHEPLTIMLSGLEGSRPLMQWHNASNNNPSLASSFVYLQPLHVSKHNLKANSWNNVTCIIPAPHLWDGVPHTTTFPLADPSAANNPYKVYHEKHGFSYHFCLEGGRDKVNNDDGLCLFPQYLKNEFHSVRATIERFSDQNKVEWCDGPTAKVKGGYVCGATLSKGDGKVSHQIKIINEKGQNEFYEITLFE